MSINYQLAKPGTPSAGSPGTPSAGSRGTPSAGSRGTPSFPANIQEAKRAVRWLRKHADRLQLDAGAIGAIGGSAGGHLTALLAVSGPECGLDPADDAEFSCRIQAAVPLYPHCASTWEGGTPLQAYDTLPMFAKTRTEAPELWDSASPIKLVSADDPPLLVVHGTADRTTPLKQSAQLHEAALAAGVPSELIVIEGAAHAFDLQPQQRDLRPVVIEFFDRHLKSRQEPGRPPTPVRAQATSQPDR